MEQVDPILAAVGKQIYIKTKLDLHSTQKYSSCFKISPHFSRGGAIAPIAPYKSAPAVSKHQRPCLDKCGRGWPRPAAGIRGIIPENLEINCMQNPAIYSAIIAL